MAAPIIICTIITAIPVPKTYVSVIDSGAEVAPGVAVGADKKNC